MRLSYTQLYHALMEAFPEIFNAGGDIIDTHRESLVINERLFELLADRARAVKP